MENLAVITALYHSGSLRNYLLSFGKKKMLFTSQGRSVSGKTVPFVLCIALRPTTSGLKLNRMLRNHKNVVQRLYTSTPNRPKYYK